MRPDRHYFRYRRHQRPEWWPENANWPPDKRHRPERFFSRMGCLFGLMFFFACSGMVFITLAILKAIGLPDVPQAIPLHGLRFVGILVAILLGIILVAAALRRMAMPVRDLMDAADRVAEGDYEVRVQARNAPSEVRAVSRSFNAMTERLQANEQQRRALLADVTHELRTPLTIIQGNLEGLLEGIYPRDDAHLQAIMDQSQHMAHLIQDLQTLSQAESGILKLDKEATDLVALVAETVASFEEKAAENGIRLRVGCEADLPSIELDPVRIREVVANLVINALRYTPKDGEIIVRCAQKGERAEVSVQDSGPGIPPEALPHVFDRFYKSADSSGSGLGLAIARNLVALHEGQIWAENQAGRGAVLHFSLPIQPE